MGIKVWITLPAFVLAYFCMKKDKIGHLATHIDDNYDYIIGILLYIQMPFKNN